MEMPDGADVAATLQVSIRKAENGYVVDVRYPAHMLFKGLPPQLQAIFRAYQKIGEAEDPMKALAEAMSGLARKAQEAPPKPLRKPHEVYVFAALEPALAFIRELFAAAES